MPWTCNLVCSLLWEMVSSHVLRSVNTPSLQYRWLTPSVTCACALVHCDCVCVLCVCVCVHKCVCVCVCMCVWACVRLYVCVHTCTCVHVCIFKHACEWMSVCARVRVYVLRVFVGGYGMGVCDFGCGLAYVHVYME